MNGQMMWLHRNPEASVPFLGRVGQCKARSRVLKVAKACLLASVYATLFATFHTLALS